VNKKGFYVLAVGCVGYLMHLLDQEIELVRQQLASCLAFSLR
jgi:hypothetical protein